MQLDDIRMALAAADTFYVAFTDAVLFREFLRASSRSIPTKTNRANLVISELGMPTFSYFWFFPLMQDFLRHATKNAIERNFVSNSTIACFFSFGARFAIHKRLIAVCASGVVNASIKDACHAALLMNRSGRSVSRGMPIRFSIITALSAVIGREPLTKERVVGSSKSNRLASSE